MINELVISKFRMIKKKVKRTETVVAPVPWTASFFHQIFETVMRAAIEVKSKHV